MGTMQQISLFTLMMDFPLVQQRMCAANHKGDGDKYDHGWVSRTPPRIFCLPLQELVPWKLIGTKKTEGVYGLVSQDIWYNNRLMIEELPGTEKEGIDGMDRDGM